MTAQILTLILSAWLIAFGLGAMVARRHRLASIVGGQLGALGAILAILTLIGPDGVFFSVLLAALTGLMGLLLAALQSVGGDAALHDEDGDPLKW
ncbi:MAG: hypothetical protein O2782_04010 [bacterium]|nr:hypothetical protein [bacterium]